MTTRAEHGYRLGQHLLVLALALAWPRPAAAQQSITEVMTFLLTNRSIPTGDFVRDERAAVETADVIQTFFALDLSTVPATPAAGGFTYRLEPSLGTVVRSSDSFGPFYAERSLTAGRGRASLGLAYRNMSFGRLDGRNLRDGTLVSTASILRGDTAPFDVETVTLRIHTDTMTVTGNYGLTDRVDLGVAVPIVRVSLEGQRVDNYRGRELLQAAGSASASGLGDVVLRGKINLMRDGASGVSIAADARLPTGDEADLLGSGRVSVTPKVIGSYEGARLGVHGEAGYSFRSVFDALSYAAAVTAVAVPRLTLVAELSGLRLNGLGRLDYTSQPHPQLVGVDTIRISAGEIQTHRVVAIAGLKWNVADTWLVTANVRRTLTEAGLNARWVPTITLDYAFGH